MALPSLALGLGLQGKPLDRAAMNLRRQEGQERAQLRAQEAERKRLEPLRKQLFDTMGKAYLPFQKEIMMDKVSKTLELMQNNVGDTDWNVVTSSIADVLNTGAVFQDNFKNISKLSVNRDYAHLGDAFKALNTLPDKESVSEYFKSNPYLMGQVGEQGNLNFNPYKYTPASTFAEQQIKLQGDEGFYEGITSQTETDKLGNTTFYKRRPKAGKVDELFNAAVDNPDVYFSEANNVFNQLSKEGKVPDLSTKEGVDSFWNTVQGKMRTDIISTADKVYQRSLAQGRGDVIINNNMPGEKDENTLNVPFNTEMYVNYGGGQFAVSAMGSAMGKETTLTSPILSNMVYLETGKRPNKQGVKATYNFSTSMYTLDKDFTTKYDITGQDAQGNLITIPKGTEFNKGAAIPKGAEQDLYKIGARFSPKIVVVGQEDTGDFLIAPANGPLLSQYRTEARNKQADMVELFRAFEEQRKQMEDWKNLTTDAIPDNVQFKQDKTKTETPKPSGRKRWDAKKGKMVNY